jgi:hypothetical protein
MVVAHVAVEVDGVYYDASGANDRTDMLINWSFESGISADKFCFEYVENVEQVRQIAMRHKCTFESDSQENANRVRAALGNELLSDFSKDQGAAGLPGVAPRTSQSESPSPF